MTGDASPFPLLPDGEPTLDRYAQLVASWREANVSGLRDAAEVRRVLVDDALALLDVGEVRRRYELAAGCAADQVAAPAGAAGRWADLGSGAGVPGIPLAVVLPAVRLTLIEATGKKCRFLRTAVRETGLAGRAEVVCARSETYAAAGAPGREAFSLVAARALGPLATAIELAAPLLAPDGVLLIGTSGERAGAEMRDGEAAAGRCGLAVARVQPLPRSPLRDSVCVLVDKVAPTPDWLPRRPGRARSHPLGGASHGVAGGSGERQ